MEPSMGVAVGLSMDDAMVSMEPPMDDAMGLSIDDAMGDVHGAVDGPPHGFVHERRL